MTNEIEENQNPELPFSERVVIHGGMNSVVLDENAILHLRKATLQGSILTIFVARGTIGRESVAKEPSRPGRISSKSLNISRRPKESKIYVNGDYNSFKYEISFVRNLPHELSIDVRSREKIKINQVFHKVKHIELLKRISKLSP